MKRRDAKTVAALTRMFEASYDRAAVYMSQAHDLRAKLAAAQARIAELQARPAAPSVEAVADALVLVEACYITQEQAIQRICGVGHEEAAKDVRRAWDDHRSKRSASEDDGA